MDLLIQAARDARERAYAPYSQYLVGASVQGSDGNIYSGCNVENISYGLSICAERNAIFQMVAAGCRELTAVAVVTKDGGTPCGACLQVMSEFVGKGEQVWVHCASEGVECNSILLSDMIPYGFRSDEVRRNVVE